MGSLSCLTVAWDSSVLLHKAVLSSRGYIGHLTQQSPDSFPRG